MEKVSVQKVTNSIKETLIWTFTNLQIDLRKNEKIIIKPNLCNYLHPSTGSTTDVKFVDALVQVIRDQNKETSIYIVESDSYFLAKVAFELLGFKLLEEKYNNVKLLNLTNDKKITKKINGFYFNKFEYPKIFESENFFISVPKLKTFDGIHDYMTCALKNQYGCNPYPKKWIYHNNLPEVIYDLNKLFLPDLILVDGIVAMEGLGPSMGIPKKMNLACPKWK